LFFFICFFNLFLFLLCVFNFLATYPCLSFFPIIFAIDADYFDLTEQICKIELSSHSMPVVLTKKEQFMVSIRYRYF